MIGITATPTTSGMPRPARLSAVFRAIDRREPSDIIAPPVHRPLRLRAHRLHCAVLATAAAALPQPPELLCESDRRRARGRYRDQPLSVRRRRAGARRDSPW